MEKGFSANRRRSLTQRSGVILALALAIGFATTGSARSVSRPSSFDESAPESVPGELIVKVRQVSGMRATAVVQSVLQRVLGTGQVLSVDPLITDAQLQKVRLADPDQVASAIQALNQDPGIAFAEPNFIYHRTETVNALPNDPEVSKLWGLSNTGQTDAAGQIGKAGSDINVTPLWEQGMTGSRNVLVAVIDTGIQWDHPDLVNNVYTNPGEAGDKASNGVDDDANGFIDDEHGWNFQANTRNSSDDHNHGTHCAGTIGAEGNNGVGVVGVNWKVTMMPVKFLSASGSGSLEGAVNAINYARQMGARIMSNSWGGGGFSQALKEAIDKTDAAGVVFVAAAGNDSSNNDSTPSYPASYPISNVISVAATDNQDKIATFSNYGTTTVHVAAPGVKVFSTVKAGGYDTFSGTSMATPHVAGIAALLLSVNPAMTHAQVKERLIKTSQPVSGLRKKVMSRGRVNAVNAMNNIIPPNTDPDESLWVDHLISVQSDHPYRDNENKTFPIHVEGAKYLRVVFDEVTVENGYDKVSVETPTGEMLDELSGRVLGYTSDYVRGDSLQIRLKSDFSNTAYGFRVSKVQVIR